MYELLRESGFTVESARGDMIRLPLRRFAVLRKASRALAKLFPGKADVITIAAKFGTNVRRVESEGRVNDLRL